MPSVNLIIFHLCVFINTHKIIKIIYIYIDMNEISKLYICGGWGNVCVTEIIILSKLTHMYIYMYKLGYRMIFITDTGIYIYIYIYI